MLHTITLSLWQAIMASCADPGYFLPVGISDITHVDRAMVDNNPTQSALFESMLPWSKEKLQGLLAIGKPEDELA